MPTKTTTVNSKTANHIHFTACRNAARCISYSISVCPSICPSHAGIVTKQMNVGSCRLYWRVLIESSFSSVRLVNIFPKGHPLAMVLNGTGACPRNDFWPI